MFSRRIVLSCASIITLGLSAGTVLAADPSTVVVPAPSATSAVTLQDLLSSKPVEPTLKRTRATNKAAVDGPSVSSPAFEPSVEPVPEKGGAKVVLPAPSGVEPQSIGTSGKPFTTRRVSPDAAVPSYPFRAAGKLFFTDAVSGGGFICSASIINKRILVTAGHCVYDAKNKRFYKNFKYVPAYNATLGTQPYGTWTPTFITTTAQWANGGGTVPNVSDFAVMVIADQVRNGSTKTIGGYLGWLGWRTNSLAGQNISALGYPGNLDSGGRMIITNSQTTAAGVAAEIGSAMAGGSSGGPWILDFGVQAAGQLLPANSGPNRVVGITSYGPVGGPAPGFYQGSSILNSDFVRIYNSACAKNAGNCG